MLPIGRWVSLVGANFRPDSILVPLPKNSNILLGDPYSSMQSIEREQQCYHSAIETFPSQRACRFRVNMASRLVCHTSL